MEPELKHLVSGSEISDSAGRLASANNAGQRKANPKRINCPNYAAFPFTVKSTSRSALASRFTRASSENLSILPLSNSLKRG